MSRTEHARDDHTPTTQKPDAIENHGNAKNLVPPAPIWSGWLRTADAIDAIASSLSRSSIPEETELVRCADLLDGTAKLLREGVIPSPKSTPTDTQLDIALNGGKKVIQSQVWRAFRVVEAASRDFVLGVNGVDEYLYGKRPHARRPAVDLGLAFMLLAPLDRFPTAAQCLINCSASFSEWRAFHWCASERLISLAEFREGGLLSEATKKIMLLQFLTPRQQSMLKNLNYRGVDRRLWTDAIRRGDLPPVPWEV